MHLQASDLASELVADVQGQVGCITLNRPKALNALTLPMIRALTQCLMDWRDDPAIAAVAIRGTSKTGPFGAFCAGGDIRFFHQAALGGDPELEDFFTEEYALDHLIHTYAKPCIAFMDGICMGGGMGLGQGASVRIVTERSKMAMPETSIGLFPDVGAGYFLSRCPGRAGEWLAMSGHSFGAQQALSCGLADYLFDSKRLVPAWQALATLRWDKPHALAQWLAIFSEAVPDHSTSAREEIDEFFSLPSVSAVVHALEAHTQPWSQETAKTLRQRSPLMLHVALEQIRRARSLTLSDALRMERGMVRHCFHTRHLGRCGAGSETVEGIRALVIDKDLRPRWNPARLEDVSAELVAPFFVSPWPNWAHPLRNLV